MKFDLDSFGRRKSSRTHAFPLQQNEVNESTQETKLPLSSRIRNVAKQWREEQTPWWTPQTMSHALEVSILDGRLTREIRMMVSNGVMTREFGVRVSETGPFVEVPMQEGVEATINYFKFGNDQSASS